MRRPIIGVTSGLNEPETFHALCIQFMEVLMHCGALPVILPITADEALLADYAEHLDGFLFSGGGDVNPLMFGQQPEPACGSISPLRDGHELTLAKLLFQRGDKPILGICRGFQVLNIALGGDVYQDLPTDYDGQLIAHRQKMPEHYASHSVRLVSGSLLQRLAGSDDIMVNSLHHQAVKRMGNGFVATAFAPDGVIEAAEHQTFPFLVGVQWHPERLWRHDMNAEALFHAFVQACSTGKAVKPDA